jgi:hypothetical protein
MHDPGEQRGAAGLVRSVAGRIGRRRRPAVVIVPIEHCRSLGATALPVAPGNPLVDTLTAYASGACHDYRDSPLCRFYAVWQPRTAAEALGISHGDLHPALQQPARDHPPKPWSSGGKTAAQRAAQPEFLAALADVGATAAAVRGHLYYGPVSTAFGDVTFARLVRLLASIQTHGYRPLQHIRGDVMRHGRQRRIDLASGKHRIAALAALGHTRVPVEVNSRIDVRDVATWVNVRAGLFSASQARAYFDRVFDGRPPEGCHWPPVT